MNKNQPHISVVSPVYRAEKIVPELVKQIVENVSKITENFEIILVNDASPDNSWAAIAVECEKDRRVKGVNLSRNFGQHRAITAGLNYAKGEWVIVMDCDLQDRPDEIPNLYAKAQEDFYIVQARRVERQDTLLKKTSSRIFHKVFAYLSGEKTDSAIGNFGIYHKKVIEKYRQMREQCGIFFFMISFLGFKKTTLDVKHSKRFEGKSSYNFRKLLDLSIDIAISNSNKLLKLTIKTGFIISILSFLLAIYNIIALFAGIITLEGFTTTVFSIWFVGGLTISILGILGLYIGKIYDEVKNRPLFVVQNELNIE
jgi:dolichol-phosphate mannosyltransferase